MEKKIERQCPVCGRLYDADPARLKHGRQTTCSRACSYQLRASEKENGTEYECAVCGKRFRRTPAQIKARHGNMCCSRECAYRVRKRTVTSPYVRTAVVDYRAASVKAWETRRANPKPYPDSARQKATARMIERIEHGDRVSQFERKAAEILRRLGFGVVASFPVRHPNGTYLGVFDIVLPVRRIAIECHGTYWHGGRWSWEASSATQTKNLAYEERKAILARDLGYDLRLLWEHDFKRDPLGAVLAVVR